MRQSGVIIQSHEKEGFLPLVRFGAWRVAILNHQPAQARGQVPFLERHHETDEVFVLLSGPATLLLAGFSDTPAPLEELPLAQGSIYNVPRGLWHAVITEQESKLLIVENDETSEVNSSYFDLPTVGDIKRK